MAQHHYEEDSSTNQEDDDGSCINNPTAIQDERPERKLPNPIMPDDLTVQLLARLDGPSYSQALYQDAKVRSVSLMRRKYINDHNLPKPTCSAVPFQLQS